MSARQEMTMVFPALPDYAGVARAALSALLTRLRAGDSASAELKAAVSEACANAARYAYAPGCGVIEMRFIVGRRKITVIIADHGRGFTVRRPPRRPLRDTDIHLGLGLKLMRRLADRAVIKSGPEGTVVTLSKKLR
ncbi:MAG: ATP-binding protein [Candidatus Margulisbacteria bacterium]|jgi:serine/threonine-protein kinase RsbW|nr:ATP-binding protein [Candidatus Margulisiibacteriota bacterium]